MKAYKHWEHDVKGFLSFIIENQHPDGYYYEIALVHDNFHTNIVDKSCVKFFPDDGIALVRIELEADIEYLVVEGAITVYKATGDDAWIKSILPALEKGINYVTSNPKRWDSKHGLVKRPFTMDTWDFVYGNNTYDRRISNDTPMSIMHGDNSGVYQAMMQLAWINRRFGNESKALNWENRAILIKKNLDKYCWNGNFYIHQLHLNHNGASGAEETKILSLSNTYDINRGVTTPEQTNNIIEEYIKRKNSNKDFAEFYCIDPPYERFKKSDGEYWKVGEYVNGGISTFTAGELAKAAFQNGYEEYGWDILCRIRNMIVSDGEVHFLYDPKTGENMSGGPSGWGSAAIIDAIDAGLAGIVDGDVCYKVLDFSPRWAVTGINEVRYITGYESSKRLIQTDFFMNDNSMIYQISCPSHLINCHILLPKGKICNKVFIDNINVQFAVSKVKESTYIDFGFEKEDIELNVWTKLRRYTIRIFFE